jgi:hypothetical protein
VDSAAAALQQLQHWQARLAMYHELRVKCGVPHPAWFVFNQLLQVSERSSTRHMCTYVGIHCRSNQAMPCGSSNPALYPILLKCSSTCRLRSRCNNTNWIWLHVKPLC